MAESRKYGRSFVFGVLQSIGGSAVLSVIEAVWSKLKHGSVDWLAIAALFVVTCFVIFLLFYFFRPGGPRSRETPKEAPEKVEQPFALATREPSIHEEARAFANRENLKTYVRTGIQCEELFSPLQLQAIQLSNNLLGLLQRMGEPPAPKYSREDIDRMSLAESRRLIESEDGDYEDSVYYHYGDSNSRRLSSEALANSITARIGRMQPFYGKVKAAYDLEFAARTKEIWNRFALEGLADDRLMLPVDGQKGTQNIRTIAATLWESAYKLAERKAP